MNKITKISALGFTLATYYFLFTTTAKAVCPVCTVTVASGLGLSRYLGIDDTVSGVWLGGLIVSSSIWLSNWLRSKNINFKYLSFFTLLLFYSFTLLPLYFTNIIGHPFNTLFGVDKFLFGTVSGTFAFLIGMYLDKAVRQKYGKQLFNYQKVILPVSALALISLILFVTTSIKIGYGG